MSAFISPDGNPEIWEEKPEGYFTHEEWCEVHPPPPPEPDTRTAEEKRETAYVLEADRLFQLAQYYEAEAKGFRLLDDPESAAEAQGIADQYLCEYAAKKREIRALYPDEEVKD